LTEPFALTSNSAGFFHNEPHAPRQKLGIGSSAAVCTATYHALADLLKRTPSLAEAMNLHRDFQGGKGSGLDVAASWTGGFIRFRDGQTSNLDWPGQLHWQVVWTGNSASTPAALSSFSQWRQRGDTHVLTELGEISHTLSEDISLVNLERYVTCLRALDRAASLNIFTQDHERLATIASAKGLLYKPCGAGGGDIGLACGEDPQALADFCTDAARDNYIPLALETAPHGVKAG
jgi:phosphomevalonate kinase